MTHHTREGEDNMDTKGPGPRRLMCSGVGVPEPELGKWAAASMDS